MADEKEQIEEGAEGLEESEGVEGEEGELGEDGEKKLGLKKILLILVPLLLLVGGAGGAYFMGYLDGLLGIEVQEEGEHAEDSDGHDEGSKGNSVDESVFIAVPPIRVNLNTDDETSRYLQLTVQLELADPADKEAVEAVIPRVIDQFHTYLRELRVRDLRGSAGIYRLQMELLWRVNQAVEPIEIKDVLFQEILIQ